MELKLKTNKIFREEKEGFQEKFNDAANKGTIVLRIVVILGKFWGIFTCSNVVVVMAFMTNLDITRCPVGV